jgi:hypothetical protein
MLHVYPTATSEAPERQDSSVLIRTDDGRCLIDAQYGTENTLAIGGNAVTFLELPAGSTGLGISSSLTLGDAGPDDPRCFVPPDRITTHPFDAQDGGHYGLIAWGLFEDLRIILLEMNGP